MQHLSNAKPGCTLLTWTELC